MRTLNHHDVQITETPSHCMTGYFTDGTEYICQVYLAYYRGQISIDVSSDSTSYFLQCS